jgi:hypothetical protein
MKIGYFSALILSYKDVMNEIALKSKPGANLVFKTAFYDIIGDSNKIKPL